MVVSLSDVQEINALIARRHRLRELLNKDVTAGAPTFIRKRDLAEIEDRLKVLGVNCGAIQDAAPTAA